MFTNNPQQDASGDVFPSEFEDLIDERFLFKVDVLTYKMSLVTRCILLANSVQIQV